MEGALKTQRLELTAPHSVEPRGGKLDIPEGSHAKGDETSTGVPGTVFDHPVVIGLNTH